MNLLMFVGVVVILLGAAYRLYGGLLGRLVNLDPAAKTPAITMRDDLDYVPIEPRFLLGQHFSAIAAAGPIAGPIIAGVAFGWGPAIAWIVLGAIFIGGVHDFMSLVASVRHNARSITEVVKKHINRRAYLLFMAFMWITIVYVIVAFTDITAQSFVGVIALENGENVSGGGIATSSLLYLALPVIMGVAMRFAGLGLGWATAIFLPLVGLSIWIGQYIPFSLEHILNIDRMTAVKVWDVVLLAYCFLAALIPMWLLLQPRGYLGGCFLYSAMIGAAIGLILGGEPVRYPMYHQWTSPAGDTLIPFLFITIACGACSGFHAIVASGTTSKQLKRETDAPIIGYGAMLLEALVATVSLCCVMMLTEDSPIAKEAPNFIYASGLANFFAVFGIPAAFGISFGLLAFATFVYDTLDVSTRLGRYIIQELTGWSGRFGRWFATALTAGVPLLFVTQTLTDAQGRVVPGWKVFWPLFGASNQLLAALTLIGITVWLVRTYRARWIWFVTGIPMVFMYAMSVTALVEIIRTKLAIPRGWVDPVPWLAAFLLGLALLMLMEAGKVLKGILHS